MDHTAAVAAKPTYPLAPTVAPKEPTWVDDGTPGGYYDDNQGHYSNNGGASWDYTPPASTYPLAPSYAPSTPVATPVDPYGYDAPYVTPDTAPADWGQPAVDPSQWSDLAAGQQAWLDTSNAGRAGSQYDRMGFQEAPTNRELVDYYQGQAERNAALGNAMGFAGKAAGGLNFTSPEQSAWNRQEEDPTGWSGQPKNAYANLPDKYAANNANPSTGIADAFGYANSGNAIVRSLGGPDLDKLPYGLGNVTDAINPVTMATIAAGPSVPVLGSAFGGGLAKRAAGEVAVNAAAMVAGEKSAEKAAEYTDNPWIVGGAGLLGGLAGAGGVLGAVGAAKRAPSAVKAADRALTGLDARIMEPAGGHVVTAGSSAELPGAPQWTQTTGELASAITSKDFDPKAFVSARVGIAQVVDDSATLLLQNKGNYSAALQAKIKAVQREVRKQTLIDAPAVRATPDVPANAATTPSEGVLGPVKPRAAEPPKPPVADAGGTPPPPRIPGELRAGPTAEEATQAAAIGRSAANPSTLSDQELLDSIKRADDMVRQADTRAADLVRSEGPQAPETVTANRALTLLEDDAERLRDEAVRRGGVAKLGEASGGGKPPVEPPALPRPEPPEIPGLPSESAKRVFNIFADAAEREGRPTTGGIFDMLAPTERAGTGLVRRYEGAVGTAGLDLRTDLDVGNRLLRDAKASGNWDGTRFVAKRTPDMEQLFKALHGEGQPPASLQKVYDAIKPMVEKESAATIDFDKAFVPRDDYFYRGWKEVPVGKAQNAGTGKGQFGAKPGFMKPRSDQSFSDILNSVYTKPDGSQVKLEPVSWNPFEMAAIRKTAGEQFRAQSDLLAGLKETGMAVSADVAPDGWRVPRVGPAFEGKPFAFTPTAKDTGPMARLADEGAAAVGYTKRIAVPDKIANDIESIFGRQPSFGALDSVLSFGQKAKQSKLLLSLFQQMDFGARTLGALNAGVIDELAETVTKAVKLQPGASAAHLVAAGRKFLAIPKDLAELPLANVSGAAQRRLRAGILDAKPIYKERPGITLKGVSEAGGKFGTDISLVTRDIMADIAKQPKPAYLTTGVVGRRIRQVNAASQRGLFDGWYVQAQSTALKKTILPRIMRQHPDWTDTQIMAGAADEVNKMFSTLGEYQTAIKNPAVKKLARGLIFSTNETEALLRGAASTVVGPNKRLWTEFYLGTFLGLATIAETIHYATTGEHLPVERLNPIDTENKYGPLPFGYRTNFLAPDIPIKGRNNTNLTLDTVMQMDTIFRLLDPKAFVESRENVLPRTITNQVTGKDFYGRPLKGPKDRITQAAIDLAEPIGIGNLRAATGFGPDSESRIGTAGALLQTAGANVRAENNAQLKDRIAVEWAEANGVTKLDGSPIKGWDDVEPSQRPDVIDSNPAAKAELEKRGEEAATLGQASGFASQTTATITRQQEESDKRLASRDISPGQWVDDYRGRVDESRIRKDEIYRASKTKPGGNPVLDGYFGALDTAKLPDGTVDWDAVDAYRGSLSPEDNAYIDRNTGLSLNTPVVKLYRDTTNNLDQTGYYDLRDKAWEQFKSTDPRLANLPDYWTWRDGELKEIIGRLESEGEDPRVVGQMAATELGKYKAIKNFSEFYRTEFRHQWVVDNPDLAKTAIYFNLFDPDAAEEKFLGMRK